MSPTAEITAASASARESNELSETTLLPTDKHYRMTGEKTAPSGDKDTDLKEIKDEQKTAAPGETGDESDTAAASEAADDEQETEEGQDEDKTEQKPQPARRTQSRQEKLSKENRELRQRLARLEAGPTRETRQESRPAAQTAAAAAPLRPKIDDVDATGQPKYATYEDWEAAKDDWLRKDTVREVQETAAKQQQEQQRQQATKRVAEEFGKRCETARKKYADYDDVALNPDLPIKEGGVVDAYIVSRPNGSDVLYHLGANPEVLDAINGMNPIDAVYALSEIELGLSAAPAAKPITRAARPPHQTSTQGTVQRDAIDAAVKGGDAAAYMREQNARDPRLTALRRSRGK